MGKGPKRTKGGRKGGGGAGGFGCGGGGLRGKRRFIRFNYHSPGRNHDKSNCTNERKRRGSRRRT